jgi:4-hydroxybenzoate polyprenyltransferase
MRSFAKSSQNINKNLEISFSLKDKLIAYAYLMRVNKLIPILLLLWPTLWALLLARPNFSNKINLKIWFVFIAGIIISRTLGCVINDLFDHKIDKQVFRTKMRPLASGVLSIKSAFALIIILCFLDLICALMLNSYAFKLSFVALGLMCFYPLSKRFFPCPQLILGAAFNWGIIMAYASLQNSLPLNAWILYFVAMCWTISYDTIYAMADIVDDKRLKVKSSALLFGDNVLGWISFFETLMLLGLVFIGFRINAQVEYYVILSLCAILFISQFIVLKRFLKEQPVNLGEGFICMSEDTRKNRTQFFIKAFSQHHWVGMLIFLAFIAA